MRNEMKSMVIITPVVTHSNPEAFVVIVSILGLGLACVLVHYVYEVIRDFINKDR